MKRVPIFVFLFGAAAICPVIAQPTQPENQVFGDFMLSCKMNKMTDKKDCTISSVPLVDKASSVTNFLLEIRSRDLVTITVEPTAVAEARVDKNKPFSFECQAAIMCTLSGRLARIFEDQLAKGKSLLIEMKPGSREKEFNLEDYQKALAAYKVQMGAGAD